MAGAGTNENLHRLRRREPNGRPQRASASERRQESREQIVDATDIHAIGSTDRKAGVINEQA